MKKHALIVAGGAPPAPDLLKTEIAKADFVIAADSGADGLTGLDIIDLTLVGDFDSISPDVLAAYQGGRAAIQVSDTHKDETDTLLAMDAAIRRGAKTITILGALGKRLDHQYANIALLLYARKQGVRAELADDTTRVFLAQKKTRITAAKGANVSVFSVTKRCTFSASTGLAYPLNGLTLYRDRPIGVSNSAEADQVTILQKSGIALIIVSQ